MTALQSIISSDSYLTLRLKDVIINNSDINRNMLKCIYDY